VARICLDVSPVVHRKAGLGSYARELAVSLTKAGSGYSFSLFHYGENLEAALPEALAGLPTLVTPLEARRWRLTVATHYAGRRDMDRSFAGIDLFHATEHLLPPLTGPKTVFTFHDAIYALFPGYHLPMNRLFLGWMMPRFLRRADAIIVVSECSRRDAVRLHGADPARIQVIYEGVDRRFRPPESRQVVDGARARLGLPDRYLLTVGTIEPRKNLITLFEAYAALLADGSGDALPPLVVVGKRGWLYEKTLRRVSELGLEKSVVFPGYLADADLPLVYAGTEMFVFPSFYEGFGLPPLEALACGAPVICSNTSSMPEVVGDAAILVDPGDAAALRRAMAAVLGDEDLRRKLREAGPRRAAAFTWEETARRTLAVYDGLLAQREPEGS